jgi:uncharacterized protein YgbK (DUF1537 family)
MFTRAGLSAGIYPALYAGEKPESIFEGSDAPDALDVTILNTNSRLDSPEGAYNKVFRAAKTLKALGMRHFYKKTCSVLRGNIGAELDAAMDALGLNFAPVVAAFPDNGRTTLDGIQYVGGTALEDTQFRYDPVNPMTISDLAAIINRQSKRRCSHISWRDLDRGRACAAEALEGCRRQGGYALFDARHNGDLDLIGDLIHGEPLICGASAIAAYTGRYFQSAASGPSVPAIPSAAKGKLILAGSLSPQSRAQIAYLRDRGTVCLELESARAMDPGRAALMKAELVRQGTEHINAGRDCVIHTTAPDSPGPRSPGPPELPRRLSAMMAELGREIITRTGQYRVIVAGGETAGDFCSRLGVRGLRVYREIQSGLPSCLTLTLPAMWLVLKAGSFGSDDFLVQALRHLNGGDDGAVRAAHGDPTSCGLSERPLH